MRQAIQRAGLPNWDLLKAALLGGRDPRPMVDKAA